MSKLKDFFKKKVDERQELELYKVEHLAYWVTFWLLFAATVVEQYIVEIPMVETYIFLISCVVLTIGCISKGLWNFQTKKIPGIKSYVLYSLAGAVIGAVFGIITVMKFEINELPVILTIVILDAGLIFVTCFVIFLLVGGIAKSREKKLEEKAMEEEDDEIDN